MTKKILFVLMLALQGAAVVNTIQAEMPFPNCAPCPDPDKK